MHAPYRVSYETQVGEALFAVPGADAIFARHGCAATFECTEDHHAEYTIGDTELVCHIDDASKLVDDLNVALADDEAARQNQLQTD